MGIISSTSVDFRGDWSVGASYSVKDAVNYSDRLFMAVADNSGVTPPTSFSTAVPTVWSPLILVEADTVVVTPSDIVAGHAYDTAIAALITSWAGTLAAAEAYSLARLALETAWTGTATGGSGDANLALLTAWAGTSAASAAYSVARTALDTAWAGTSAASNAYGLADLAVTRADSSLASSALAYNIANLALVTAWAGTNSPALSTLPDVTIPSPLAQQVLTYDGSKWVAEEVRSTSASGLYTLFVSEPNSGTNGYEVLSASPAGGSEQLDTVTLNNNTVFIDGYITNAMNRPSIEGGVWTFNNYLSSSSGAECLFLIDVYTRSISGVETYLFSGTSVVTSVSPLLHQLAITEPSFATSFTDKLVVKYFGRSSSSTNFTLYHDGTLHATCITTPAGVPHNSLTGLQGGIAGASSEFYHLSQSEHSSLQTLLSSSPATASDISSVYSLARTALDTAWVGTNTGGGSGVDTLALTTAWAGTTAAAAAYRIGRTALDTAWTGTSAAAAAYRIGRTALDTAWTGTSAAAAAYSVGRTALDTAWAGTAAAAAAYALASQLSGTLSGGVTSGRELLSANRTYYVSTTGNDSNTGLTVGAPFLTPQKAMDVVANSIDNGGYDVTVQLADGVYANYIILKTFVGSGSVIFNGNAASNVNVTLAGSGNGIHTIDGTSGGVGYPIFGKFTFQNMYLRASNAHVCYVTGHGTCVKFGTGVYFHTVTAAFGHLIAQFGGQITVTGPIYIAAGCALFAYAANRGVIRMDSANITLINTPQFTGAFVYADSIGLIYAPSIAWTGSGLGPRYNVSSGAVINSGGAGANYFPGNQAGVNSVPNPGFYY